MSASPGSRPCASRAPAADQRRGRAGRTEPGVCYRLWDEPQTASLEAYARPEILAADLSSLLLDLAQWGTSDPATLAFLDPPPAGALTEARALLVELGAIDAQGRITDEGRKLRRLPLPPRLARMVVDAAAQGEGQRAADIAAILSERGLGGDGVDLSHRLDQFRRDRSRRGEDARRMSKRWADDAAGGAARNTAEKSDLSAGAILSLAYPDRIAKTRGGNGTFLLANGRGANIDPASALSREPFLAVAELSGTAAQGRILLAASITLEEIEARFADRIENREEITFDTASASLRGRRSERLGAIALAERPFPAGSAPDAASKLAEGIVRIGLDRLPWSKPLQQWRDRVMFLRRAEGDEWPDLSNDGLAANAAEWLAPMLDGKTALSQVGADELSTAIQSLLALGSQAPPRRGGADAFFRAVRLVGADRLRGRGGAEALDPGAGAVRPRPASGHRPRQGSAAGGTAVAGAPPGAGHPRPAGLLARLLRRGENRDARPLSAPSLARQPAAGARHPPRQTAWHIRIGT